MQKYKKHFPLGYVLFLAFFLSFSGLNAEETYLSKEEMWDEMSEEVNSWVDKLGLPLDEEIKEVVIALNLMGVETQASCEGHLDWGFPYPWVAVKDSSAEIYTVQAKLYEKYREIEIEEESLQGQLPSFLDSRPRMLSEEEFLDSLYIEYHKLTKELLKAEENCKELLNKLLNEFYENHSMVYDNVLIVDNYRIKSAGADRQHARTNEEQDMKLREYREEMNAFAAFLKEKFMNSL